MPVIFHEQDPSYNTWMKRNPNGYVLYLYGGKNPWTNKIHHVECWKLKHSSESNRKPVQKVCCENLEDLKAYANVLRGGKDGWTYCKTCFPVQKNVKKNTNKKQKSKLRK